MGDWLVDADVLARSRFAISPLAEVTATLLRLPGSLAEDPLAAALVECARGRDWIPDLLAAPPRRRDGGWAAELQRLRAYDAEATVAELTRAFHGNPPAVLVRPDVIERIAELAAFVWTSFVEPEWDRTRALLEADIVTRSHRISQDGWHEVLSSMRPGLTWLGDGRLRINSFDYPPQDLAGAELLLIPSSAHGGWVGWDLPHTYSIVYRAAGLASSAPPLVPGSLGRLVGATRADLLIRLVEPRSTSQLVAATGLSLGTVGEHLRVLLDAGLLSRRRAGTSVLYAQTALAERLVSAHPRSG